jgi:hypothetical protein
MSGRTRRPPGIVIVGIFAFVAGLGEVVVGFTGNYLGILAHSMAPSFSPEWLDSSIRWAASSF